jgi:hypothetical protein
VTIRIDPFHVVQHGALVDLRVAEVLADVRQTDQADGA